DPRPADTRPRIRQERDRGPEPGTGPPERRQPQIPGRHGAMSPRLAFARDLPRSLRHLRRKTPLAEARVDHLLPPTTTPSALLLFALHDERCHDQSPRLSVTPCAPTISMAPFRSLCRSAFITAPIPPAVRTRRSPPTAGASLSADPGSEPPRASCPRSPRARPDLSRRPARTRPRAAAHDHPRARSPAPSGPVRHVDPGSTCVGPDDGSCRTLTPSNPPPATSSGTRYRCPRSCTPASPPTGTDDHRSGPARTQGGPLCEATR